MCFVRKIFDFKNVVTLKSGLGGVGTLVWPGGQVITRPRVLSPTLYVPEATTTRVDR